ncbi:MAG TPA: hypothetical protein VJ011_07805 [Steroidobacteraceae bacterium]|nr:hypothetical protein [Steroidobacteraceae bacterium]
MHQFPGRRSTTHLLRKLDSPDKSGGSARAPAKPDPPKTAERKSAAAVLRQLLGKR